MKFKWFCWPPVVIHSNTYQISMSRLNQIIICLFRKKSSDYQIAPPSSPKLVPNAARKTLLKEDKSIYVINSFVLCWVHGSCVSTWSFGEINEPFKQETALSHLPQRVQWNRSVQILNIYVSLTTENKDNENFFVMPFITRSSCQCRIQNPDQNRDCVHRAVPTRNRDHSTVANKQKKYLAICSDCMNCGVFFIPLICV